MSSFALPETSNPYEPATSSGSVTSAEHIAKYVSRYTVSVLLLAAGIAASIMGLGTLTTAVHGLYPFHWALISALLTACGLLWTMAAIACMKRRTRAGFWLSVAGFAAFFCSMNVGIPA